MLDATSSQLAINEKCVWILKDQKYSNSQYLLPIGLWNILVSTTNLPLSFFRGFPILLSYLSFLALSFKCSLFSIVLTFGTYNYTGNKNLVKLKQSTYISNLKILNNKVVLILLLKGLIPKSEGMKNVLEVHSSFIYFSCIHIYVIKIYFNVFIA